MPKTVLRTRAEAFARDKLNPSADEYEDVLASYKSIAKSRYGDYRIGLVTALPKETAAVVAVLGPGEELYHDFTDAPYTAFDVAAAQKGKRHKIVLMQAPKMGNSSSAIAAFSLIKDFRELRDVVMVGIAGGIPDHADWELDIRVGDIVVSNGLGLVQYDMLKIEDTKSTARSVQSPPSAFLSSRVSKLEADRVQNGATPWVDHLPRACSIAGGARPSDEGDVMSGKRTYAEGSDLRRLPGLPVVHLGVIASANSLLKSAQRRDDLRSSFKALAVEMEGSGIGDAAWFSGKGYLVIRGICDYCDMAKNDDWQGYAAAAAAAYLRALLEVTPVRSLD